MKKIEAIIQPDKLDAVRDALVEADIVGMTISPVEGFGKQQGVKEIYRGVEIVKKTVAKIKIEVVVSSDEWLNKALDIIIKTARTGNVGDGKIFVYEISKVVRIRTGEEDAKAL
jgi:nitrogen regulatory protein P-II 1